MEQSKARNIISSLSSLYPLKDYEEDAIITLLTAREPVWYPEEETDICPSCGSCLVNIYVDNFCRKCGQPLERE